MAQNGTDEYDDDFEQPPESDSSDSESDNEPASPLNPEGAKAELEKAIIDPNVPLRRIHTLAGLDVLQPNLDFALPESQLSPLELAVQNKRTDVAGLILNSLKADVDFVCGLASTCLAQCVFSYNPEVHELCTALLRHGANPNVLVDAKNSSSMPCLHFAVSENHIELVKLLLDYPITDLNLRWEEMTPLGLALDLDMKAMIALIQEQEVARAKKESISFAGSSVPTYDWAFKWEDLTLHEPLGTGGFGTVYRAKLKKGNDAVAVKKCTVQDSSMLNAFRKEVQLMASFRHENIVLFRGACLELPNLCIVLELMTTGNLYNLLHSDQDLPWSLRLRWVRDIARGMNYLHNLAPPVIHRDLKSPNILVNEYHQVKLCDFGMSRSKEHTRVHTKEHGGSPLWMAPECLRGDPFTEKSDVYSFGVVMWEIMTRQVPWGDKEVVQLIGLVGFRNETLAVPAAPVGCPAAYVEIMRACWLTQPEMRPAFGELVERLEDLTR